MRKICKLFLLYIIIPPLLHFSPLAMTMEIPVGNTGALRQESSSAGNIAYLDIEKVFAEHPMTGRLKDEFKADVDNKKKEIQDMEAAIDDIQKVIISTTTEIFQIKTQLTLLKNSNQAAAQVGISTETLTAAPNVITSSIPAEVPFTTSTISALSHNTAIANPLSALSTAPADTISAEASTAITSEKFEREIREKEEAVKIFNQEISKRKDEITQKVKRNREDLINLEEKQTQKVLADIYRILEKIAQDENLSIVVNKDNVLYGPPNRDITEKVLERLQGR